MIKTNIAKRKKIVIIGAGLAGLTLATELLDQGHEVVILEKNKYLGGRASNTKDKTTGDPVPIGPHIFMKGYHNFKRFLHKINAREAIVWERNLFIELIYEGRHYQFRMTDIPTSLKSFPKILSYPFLTLRDKITNLRIGFKIYFGNPVKFEKLDELNAYEYLVKNGVNENSINKMWRFFVLSMLNVPLEFCSAAELCLLAKYWATVDHREIGFAGAGLGDIYTIKAEEYIEKKGGSILRNSDVKEIVCDENNVDSIKVKINGETQTFKADVYVSALNPIQLRELFHKNILVNDFFRSLNAFEPVPYISVNLWFDKKLSNKKFWALLNDSATSKYLNLDFYDESNIYEPRKNKSYVASNIIYSQAYKSMTDEEIVKETLKEVKVAFPKTKAKLIHYQVHRIPYVIYAPFPGMRKHKLPNKTPLGNFYLTGDWTNKNMTQSMEAAVESGYQCFEVMMNGK